MSKTAGVLAQVDIFTEDGREFTVWLVPADAAELLRRWKDGELVEGKVMVEGFACEFVHVRARRVEEYRTPLQLAIPSASIQSIAVVGA